MKHVVNKYQILPQLLCLN